MNPSMTKEPLIILRGKKGSQGTGVRGQGQLEFSEEHKGVIPTTRVFTSGPRDLPPQLHSQ